jgi:hypothetical protein
LPLAANHAWLALGAYLGGFSAATGMVIVETIALSTMICNEVVMPMLLRSSRFGQVPGRDLSGLIKTVRRVAIVLVIALAYGYFRLFTGPGTLTQIGLLSFAAVAQFAPSLVGGVLWRGGRYRGVVTSLVVGFATWAYTLLMPAVLLATGYDLAILRDGPFGIAWLRPEALFGVSGLGSVDPWRILEPVAQSHFLCRCLAVAGAGFARAPPGGEVSGGRSGAEAPERGLPRSSATVGDLQELVERFLGSERTTAAFRRILRPSRPGSARQREHAGPELARFVEHMLAGVLGTSSARLVLGTTLRGPRHATRRRRSAPG